MKNRILSVFLVAMMVAGILPMGVHAESLPDPDQPNQIAAQDSDVISVNSWEELRDAVENAPTDGTIETIEISGSFSKDGYGINIEDGKNIIIQSGAGGPYTITRDTSKIDSFFSLFGSNKTLTLKNIVLDGNGDNVTSDSTMIYLEGASFIMDSGAVIQNAKMNLSMGYATAVTIVMNNGTFTMKPGSEIKNVENLNEDGNGAVANYGGTFIMEGGRISGSKGAIAGGIRNYGTLRVSGLINISDNIDTDTGAQCNVYSSSIITVDTAGLDFGSKIGVTMSRSPHESRPVDITGNNSADYSSNFISDDLNYTVKKSGTGENQVVQLTVPDTVSPVLTAGAAVRTGHTAGTVKFTSNESGSYYYKVVEAGADEPVIETGGDGESCTTSETTITDPAGLTAGAKDIYIKVKDAAGNVSAAIKIDIEAYKEPGTVSGGGSSSSGSSSGGSTSEPTQQEDAVKVIVNGKEHNAGKETTAVEGGKTAVTIELNNKVIESKIDEAIRNNPKGTGNVIMVPVADTKAGIAKVELTGDIVRRLESNAFDVSIKRGDIEYVIPAEEFTINKAAENLGVAENDFQDISIEVRIEKLDEKTSEEYRKAARENGAELIFSPVSFEIVAKTTDKYGKIKDFTISKFSNYVERIMEIPAGIDKNRITTGIVFNSDGTYSHVPTSVFEKDGRWYARVNSLTNSDYSVIYNAVTVESADKHWAKDTINDMASRLVLSRPESFEPDKFISRADFAEYIVRALGIYREDSLYENKFNDLNGDKSQTQAILIASEYGIASGYPDGTFRPGALITRQEAMAMYQRVMKVTRLTGSDQDRYKNYKDFKDVNDWAKSDVKEALSAHVFNGTSETAISPKSNLTCAEALQAIKNLLVESQLINK